MSNKPKVEKVEKKEQALFEYEIEELMANCEGITGLKREVAEGALHEVKETKMTKKAFKEKINEFLKRRVK